MVSIESFIENKPFMPGGAKALFQKMICLATFTAVTVVIPLLKS